MNKRRKNRKSDYKSKVIFRQIEEIDRLKKCISELQISCDEKDTIINSIEFIRQDFLNLVDELKKKKDEYEKHIEELIEMKNSFNQIVFKGKWSLIRLLIK
ncbi:MAG: hypothetical protein IJZ77_03055 [Bacilli bacterium]|nr:hypothetical protein [Bacilli bacterium]